MRRSCLSLLAFLAACGGASSSPQPSAPAPAPIVSGPDFSQIGAEVERWSIANATLIIGDANGELYRYEKGSVQADTVLNIASATKLQTGLAVWSLIEDAALSETSKPQDHIAFWATDPSDPRATVTLDQLMSFRSGFNSRPT
ncbi:MAG: serine hydrolase, partial [Pseudomonadota bacterium]